MFRKNSRAELGSDTKIAACRRLVVNAMPYAATLLYRLEVTEQEKEEEATTFTSAWRLKLAQDEVKAMDFVPWRIASAGIAALFDFAKQGRARSQQRKWVLACNLVLNEMCGELKLKVPEEAPTPAMLELEPNLSALEYYNLLPDEPDKPDDGDGEDEGGKGESNGPLGGGGVTGETDDEEQGQGQGGDSDDPLKAISQGEASQESARNMLRRGVGDAIQAEKEGSKGIGDVPGRLQTWADFIVADSPLDWRALLDAWRADTTGAFRAGAGTSSYRRPSRRQQRWDRGAPLFPSTWKPRPKYALLLDSSGSMGNDDIKAMVSEAVAIASGGCDLYVYVYDMVLQAEFVVVGGGFNQEHMKECFKGRGGTCMTSGLRLVRDRAEPIAGVIVATDGGTSWPTEEMPWPVIVVMPPNNQWGREQCPYDIVVPE